MAGFLKAPVNYKPEGNEEINKSSFSFYSPETGIYSSKYPSMNMPSDPYLDVVSFIFSQKHDGIHALIDSSSGFTVTYSMLQSLVKSTASGIHTMGVKKGDVVMILLPNSPFFPIIFLACLSIGAVVTPMNPLSSLQEIRKQALDCKPVAVFSIENRADELTGALPDSHVIGVDLNLNSGIPVLDSALHKLMHSDPLIVPNPKIEQQDIAAILYSSGTTGRPKGTLLTHGNFIAMMELFVRFEASTYGFQVTENVFLAIVPMFHIYGLSLFVMGLLSLGSTVVTMTKFDADEMVKAVQKYGVTHIHAAPPLVSG